MKSGTITVTFTEQQKLVALNLLTVKIDNLRSARTRRMNYGASVDLIESEIKALRELRRMLAPIRREIDEALADDERSELAVSASIARVKAALEAAEALSPSP